jgi:cytidylate kinase
LQRSGTPAEAETVEAEMRERDGRDRTRAEAPLVQAPDAQLIETTGLNIEQVEEAVLKVIRSRTSNGKTASFSGSD